MLAWICCTACTPRYISTVKHVSLDIWVQEWDTRYVHLGTVVFFRIVQNVRLDIGVLEWDARYSHSGTVVLRIVEHVRLDIWHRYMIVEMYVLYRWAHEVDGMYVLSSTVVLRIVEHVHLHICVM